MVLSFTSRKRRVLINLNFLDRNGRVAVLSHPFLAETATPPKGNNVPKPMTSLLGADREVGNSLVRNEGWVGHYLAIRFPTFSPIFCCRSGKLSFRSLRPGQNDNAVVVLESCRSGGSTRTERQRCRSVAPPVVVLESCRSGALPQISVSLVTLP